MMRDAPSAAKSSVTRKIEFSSSKANNDRPSVCAPLPVPQMRYVAKSGRPCLLNMLEPGPARMLRLIRLCPTSHRSLLPISYR